MKKSLIAFLLGSLIWTMVGCGQTSTTVATNPSLVNPNDNYCTLNISGAYVCSKSWTSYFNTTISLTLYYTGIPEYGILTVFNSVDSVLDHYHSLFDKYHTYPDIENIYTINRDSSIPDGDVYGTKNIDEDLFSALIFALRVESEITFDASSDVQLFNIALSPVLSLWHNARASFACSTSDFNYSVCPLPATELIDATYNIDPDDIILDVTNSSISFAKTGMGIDLGGFGKGYVSEVICDMLDAQSIVYLLNSGNSNIKAGGANPNRADGSFYIAMTEPSFASSLFSSYYAYLRIMAGSSVVTSGSYQNFFVGQTDNIVYHHIINPSTYRPGGDQITLSVDDGNNLIISPTDALLSVTIICESGDSGDIYSTTLFLMTYLDGLALINATPGYEAIWYFADGSFQLSSGLEESEIEVSSGVFKPLITVK